VCMHVCVYVERERESGKGGGCGVSSGKCYAGIIHKGPARTETMNLVDCSL
jgi:hypothetical protein